MLLDLGGISSGLAGRSDGESGVSSWLSWAERRAFILYVVVLRDAPTTGSFVPSKFVFSGRALHLRVVGRVTMHIG
jgi:hypothetical protein